jgi:hypothetical protein
MFSLIKSWIPIKERPPLSKRRRKKSLEVQTARVAEILEHNPGLFKIASDVLPLNVL